jgi:hypothetical protein
MYRRFVALALALVIVAIDAQTASAGSEMYRWTDGNGVGAGTSTSSDNPGSQSGGGGGKSHSDLKCVYVTLTDDQIAFLNQNGDIANLNHGQGLEEGKWFNVMCSDPAGNIVSITPAWVPNAPTPQQLAQQAFDYNALPIPAITLSPDSSKPQLVNLPTWLSVNSTTWTPISASASAAGVNVTTTATPTSVSWTTGDGNHVTCNGPGATYDPTKPDGSQHTDCSYTYTRTSTNQPNGRYALTATVTWTVGWSATGVPAGTPANGALPGVTRTATVNVQVVEVQALNQHVR